MKKKAPPRKGLWRPIFTFPPGGGSEGAKMSIPSRVNF